MYVYGNKERLLQDARGDMVDRLEAASISKKKNEETEKTTRLRIESFTWSAFETN